jgi:glycosyltransferase involved in cell wall biosynthesis
MKKCSVLIPSYGVSHWVMECINGFKTQDPVEGYSIDIVVGVDGCKDTYNVLKKNNIPFYYSEKNVGPYIILNSLILLNVSDVFVFFGSDDVPTPAYLKEVIPVAEKHGFTKAPGYKCDPFLVPKKVANTYWGSNIFSQKVFDELGGFYHYRCSGDNDFKKRAKMAGFGGDITKKYFTQPLFYRRKHPNSLTSSGTTKKKSIYRRQVRAEMEEYRKNGIIKITPAVTKLERIS